jgi:hypothetical protein
LTTAGAATSVVDRLARRQDQFVGGSRHVKPGGEQPENRTVRLGQFHQDIHQFRFLPPGQRPAQLDRKPWWLHR